MTPIDIPKTQADFQYNLAHAATHEIGDQTFKALQTRFRCLDSTKGYLQVFHSSFCTLYTILDLIVFLHMA